MTLPAHVAAEVQRILDRAARRLLAEHLKEAAAPPPITEPAQPPEGA